MDAIQEFAVETSNFAAEFGQVGGGYFNVTMKSGTNQFHGSAYEYFVNEDLNAGTAFTNNGNGQLLRPRQRRNRPPARPRRRSSNISCSAAMAAPHPAARSTIPTPIRAPARWSGRSCCLM